MERIVRQLVPSTFLGRACMGNWIPMPLPLPYTLTFMDSHMHGLPNPMFRETKKGNLCLTKLCTPTRTHPTHTPPQLGRWPSPLNNFSALWNIAQQQFTWANRAVATGSNLSRHMFGLTDATHRAAFMIVVLFHKYLPTSCTVMPTLWSYRSKTTCGDYLSDSTPTRVSQCHANQWSYRLRATFGGLKEASRSRSPSTMVSQTH